MNLNTPLEETGRLSEVQKKALKRLGLENVRNLLYHLPNRHEGIVPTKTINSLVEGEKVAVVGKVLSQETKKAWRRKIPMAEMVIEDQTGKIKAVWFHQAYMAKKVPAGSFVRVQGTATDRNGSLYLANPVLDQVDPETTGPLFQSGPESKTSLIPVYPETRGISSLWIYSKIQQILKTDILEDITDPIPEEILKKYNLPSLKTAFVWMHAPKKAADAEAAHKRFSFEEIFFIQLSRLKNREEYRSHSSFQIDIDESQLTDFIDRFPFKPTKAQKSSIETILKDLRKDEPMTRLLEGDVGSGKTAVAASTVYGVTITRPKGEGGKRQDFGNLQTAYMAPTEILARQHFESFIEYFRHLPIQIGLITGTECRKFPSKVDPEGHAHVSRKKLLDWVKSGEIPILIGTHALIQKTVEFKHLAYVIIDEQHRFGTMQRAALTRKDGTAMTPHLLSMTATPIPRTLALTLFGDLDLTLLDEMPKGRKPIITESIDPKNRDVVYKKVRKELEAGRQAYVICPRIDEPDPAKELAVLTKSVKAESERLQKDVFQDYVVGMVHSKMRPKEKEEIMNDFAEGKIDILTATSVVEVGVNVPNATTIIIEGAERFGLSQLHQLRGRVIRSSHQAYCYLFSEGKSAKTKDRFKALTTAKNGFELSEKDLKLRGPGALAGRKQWGISDIGMEAIKNIKMVEAARTEAQKIIKKDPDLTGHKEILDRIDLEKTQVHFE